MTLILTAAFLGPAILCLVLTRVMISLAPRLGLVDRPDPRKFHSKITPLGGGVAIYLSVVLSLGGVYLLAWLAQFPSVAKWLPEIALVHAPGVLSSGGLLGMIVAAASVQMLLGLADDWLANGLSYQLRLGVEVLLVLGLITQGVGLTLFMENLWLTAPITVLWIVGLTNAVNFLDNMDALSAGVSLIASALFATIAYLVGDLFIAGCFLVVAGALLGFLRYNWGPAKIFMGDAGSNFLGFWLGVFTVAGTFHTENIPHVTIFAPLVVLAVPIYDSSTVICIRIAQGRSPFHPDKQHLSHRLVQLGLRPKAAVSVIYLITITTGLGGVLLYHIHPAGAPLVVLQVFAMLGVIALLEYAAHRNSQRLATANANAITNGPEGSGEE